MFNKLKDKLKNWISKVSKEEAKVHKEKEKPEKEFIKETKKEKIKEEISKIEKPIEEKEEIEEVVEEKKKQSFFKKIFSKEKIITDEEFDKYAEELENLLLENNVALEVSDKIIEYLKKDVIGEEIPKKEIEERIRKSLSEIIELVLVEPFDLLEKIKKREKSPFVILFCGINGTGKTTTIAKIAYLLKRERISSLIAAGDTFRAASIEQLRQHSENLNVKLISQEYGSDPASVGFDAIQYAKNNKIDVVLIDTAGRMHTAKNLLREMEKIKRVCKPNLTIFVGESITGNDSTEQVRAFNETIEIDAIILSKADVDEKGGTALSVGYTTKKPIIYLGTGQDYNQLEKFDKKRFVEKLGL